MPPSIKYVMQHHGAPFDFVWFSSLYISMGNLLGLQEFKMATAKSSLWGTQNTLLRCLTGRLVAGREQLPSGQTDPSILPQKSSTYSTCFNMLGLQHKVHFISLNPSDAIMARSPNLTPQDEYGMACFLYTVIIHSRNSFQNLRHHAENVKINTQFIW